MALCFQDERYMARMVDDEPRLLCIMVDVFLAADSIGSII